MSECRQDRPLYLRISVTDRCQLRCVYCMPPGGVQHVPREHVLSFEQILRFVRVARAGFGLSKVRITGGEPLVRAGVVELVAMLAAEGVSDLALTTNGQLLAEMAAELKRAGLRRVNVSLDSLDEATFRALSRRGELRRTLRGIEAALRHGLTPVKVNAVVLRGCNDSDVAGLVRFGLERGCEVRLLELMPVGQAAALFDRLFVPASEVRRRLERRFRLEPLPERPGQSSRDFSVSDGRGLRGTVGFISPQTQPFCRGCTRLRLTSTGGLISCLAAGDRRDIRSLLRSESQASALELTRLIAAELAGKPRRRPFRTVHSMAGVGG